MPENLYYKLLGTDPDVLNPDLYQLLELNRDDVSDDQVEAQYKAKMKRLQEVRSTKYKHFVEFLKGQLQSARRTLTDAAARKRYDEEILVAALTELKRLVQAYIQLSGDLSELEVSEVLARGRQLNVGERLVHRLIDRQLAKFGYRRVAASAEQVERARRILKDRESSGGISDTARHSYEALLAELAQEVRLPPDGTPSFREPAGVPRAPSGAAAVGAERPRVVWSGKGGSGRFVRQMPDGSVERPLVFLAMPESNLGRLVEQVTTYVCESAGLQVYRTRGERWERALTQLKACDLLIADFSPLGKGHVTADASVVVHAAIAKYAHDTPVLALTQEPPERRLPGWQFVFYDAERITDTQGESFPDRLKRALRRNLR